MTQRLRGRPRGYSFPGATDLRIRKLPLCSRAILTAAVELCSSGVGGRKAPRGGDRSLGVGAARPVAEIRRQLSVGAVLCVIHCPTAWRPARPALRNTDDPLRSRCPSSSSRLRVGCRSARALPSPVSIRLVWAPRLTAHPDDEAAPAKPRQAEDRGPRVSATRSAGGGASLAAVPTVRKLVSGRRQSHQATGTSPMKIRVRARRGTARQYRGAG
jgi:hypothetical protein